MPTDSPVAASDAAAPPATTEECLPLATAAPSCQDCAAPLTGPYCAQCGQRADLHVPTMAEVAHDVVHSALHLDGRVWRTLRSLLLRPGELTREFIAGRRQRYLPPFRLYLVISIGFFAVSSLLPDGEFLQVAENRDTVLAPVVIGSRGDGGSAAVDGSDPAPADAPPAAAGAAAELRRGVVAVEVPSSCSLDSGLPALDRLMAQACHKLEVDGGKRLGEVFLGNAPKRMFLFLPLMAGITALFYWSPRRRYVEHLVLYLHTHSLTFLVLAAGSLIGPLTRPDVPGGSLLGILGLLLVGYVPYYVYRTMRVVYGDSRLRTFAKFAALGTVYFNLLGITLLVGIVYSLLSL